MSQHSRRRFLDRVASSVGAVSFHSTVRSTSLIATAFASLRGRIARSDELERKLYGELHPVLDQSTGLPLIKLPDGFRYISYGWTNQPLASGVRTPSDHDGMAVIAENEHTITLCRNHEVMAPGASFWREHHYDPFGSGGCTNLAFDRRRETFVAAWESLGGTMKNCAGGATPWNTWLSCEETLEGPETLFEDGSRNPLTQPHGFVFEVPSDGQREPKPLLSLGRFVHEAVAVDPISCTVYLTEDTGTAGFYRMTPDREKDIASFGRFEMMRIKQREDVRTGIPSNSLFDVSWVEIPDRLRAHSPGTLDGLGVFHQGKDRGGLTFARLEGVAIHEGKVFITSTSGGDAKAGQVWEYNPEQEQLRLVFESPDPEVLDMPDNMCVNVRGELLLCEDGTRTPQRLQILTSDGLLCPFAENNIVLDQLYGHRGDFRGSEWAGATFSKDGTWLFVNIQKPGVTLAITGPWKHLH